MLVEFTHHEVGEVLIRFFICYFIEVIGVNYLDFILFFILPLMNLIVHVWFFFACYFIEDIDVNYLDFILFFILLLIKTNYSCLIF